MEKVKKQYGLWTGIAMVVGIVIGSGVFLKAGGVLTLAGGDLKISILAWFVGGLIMVCSGFCFAIYATKVSKYNGVVDYVEQATNKKVGYGLAWLITTVYYPIIAGYFQVSTTVIKLIPILVIAVAGLFASLIVGDGAGIGNAFANPALGLDVNFGEAVKKTAFAYEGWVCATAINAELKDSKKNLPRALVIGTIAILLFYIVYYISLSAFLGNAGTIIQDANAPIAVFEKIMGTIGGAIFTVFIMISCLGTVNGVAMSCCRGMYTMSCRGQGPAPEKFSKLGRNQSVSLLSCLYGLGCMILMLGVWYLAMHGVWIFKYLGSMDEIVCAIIYGVYITMYIYIMKTFKDCNVFQRFVMPIVAIIGSLFFVICGTGVYQLIASGFKDWESLKAFGVFLLLFVVLMAPCLFFYNEGKHKEVSEN